MNDNAKTNAQLLSRLGIDSLGLRRVGLLLEIGKAPTLTIERYGISRSGEIKYDEPTSIKRLEWKAIEDDPQ